MKFHNISIHFIRQSFRMCIINVKMKRTEIKSRKKHVSDDEMMDGKKHQFEHDYTKKFNHDFKAK